MSEEVHVGRGNRKSKLPRWQFVVALTAAVVLAIAIGGTVRWITTRQPAPNKTSEHQLPEVVEDVQNLRIGSKPEEAKEKIDAALNDPKTSDSIKYQLYIQQGILGKEKGSMMDAIASFERAASIKITNEIANLLGDAYAKAGDKAKAISWYQKAIPLIKTEEQGNPLYEVDKADLEELIRNLGGQP